MNMTSTSDTFLDICMGRVNPVLVSMVDIPNVDSIRLVAINQCGLPSENGNTKTILFVYSLSTN